MNISCKSFVHIGWAEITSKYVEFLFSSGQGTRLRSVSPSFRLPALTPVFMDAQSKMIMGQIQQTAFLVQIVGLFLLLHPLFFTDIQFSVQYWDTRGFILCSVLMFQSCMECAYVRTLVVRLKFTALYLRDSFVIPYCYWLIWTPFFTQSEKKSNWHPWCSTRVWLTLVRWAANSSAV